ncbi:transposase [Ruegeria sp. HKCCD7318]|uniref:transposase n=1 Tax=Ruegeria sp. HKCCD7318 TaxID=2683014 RepID=UPI0014920891|nr:transposase [Ruegeria sp. HKCCD7318]NOE35831.1 transposase [Ruegeria sp. HKCCD7318]
MFPAIPLWESRKKHIGVNRTLYRLRNLAERRVNKLKNACRVACRYDKAAESYLGSIDITSTHL